MSRHTCAIGIGDDGDAVDRPRGSAPRRGCARRRPAAAALRLRRLAHRFAAELERELHAFVDAHRERLLRPLPDARDREDLDVGLPAEYDMSALLSCSDQRLAIAMRFAPKCLIAAMVASACESAMTPVRRLRLRDELEHARAAELRRDREAGERDAVRALFHERVDARPVALLDRLVHAFLRVVGDLDRARDALDVRRQQRLRLRVRVAVGADGRDARGDKAGFDGFSGVHVEPFPLADALRAEARSYQQLCGFRGAPFPCAFPRP